MGHQDPPPRDVPHATRVTGETIISEIFAKVRVHAPQADAAQHLFDTLAPFAMQINRLVNAAWDSGCAAGEREGLDRARKAIARTLDSMG